MASPVVFIAIFKNWFIKDWRYEEDWNFYGENQWNSRDKQKHTLQGIEEFWFDEINNHDLDELVGRYKQSHPHDGKRMLIGQLQSQNVYTFTIITKFVNANIEWVLVVSEQEV